MLEKYMMDMKIRYKLYKTLLRRVQSTYNKFISFRV